MSFALEPVGRQCQATALIRSVVSVPIRLRTQHKERAEAREHLGPVVPIFPQ